MDRSRISARALMRNRASRIGLGVWTAAAALVAMALLPAGAFASGSAQGPPAGPTSPPFTQCPAVGHDTSCGYLIDVTSTNPAAPPTVKQDSTQPPFDKAVHPDDVLVAVQNDTASQLQRIRIGVRGSHERLMAFDGDGLCTASPRPEGCPFGPSLADPFSYQGPDTELVAESGEAGEVVFPAPLEPGQYTYFSLEAEPKQAIVAGALNDVVKTTLTNTQKPEEKGTALKAEQPVPVTDRATITGENAATAGGTVEYVLYYDAACTKVVEKLGSKKVQPGGIAEESDPSSATLSPNATYYWQATYSGDAHNSPNKSACGGETMTFGRPPEKEASSITTKLSGGGVSGPKIEVGEGTPVTDTAFISAHGGGPVTGRLTYAAYARSDCSGTPVAGLGSGGATTGVGPSTNPVKLPAGTYYFQAFYSGSETLQPASTPCGSEVLVVVAAPAQVTGTGPPPPSSSLLRPPLDAFTLTAFVGERTGRIVIVTHLPEGGEVKASGVVVNPTPKAAGKARCAHTRGRHKCAKSTRTAFGASSLTVFAAGTYALVIRPANPLLQALRRGHRLEVLVAVTFRSFAGGTPVTHVLRLLVRIRRPTHGHPVRGHRASLLR